uniref:Ribosomal RNA-processing protein 7 C-terminal domain-containing protein n=1 Tax=Pseudo-nitzschia australis TaxID=44445 RepID=A0A7S4ABL7_9STRA
MPAASSSSSSVPLIKGYIPVRLRLPRQPQLVRLGNDNDDNDENNTEDTFFFVREHQGKSSEDSNDATTSSTTATTKRGTTLFVANAPIVPGVSTKLLLKSIFGRFAEVTRVTAVQNPRAAAAAAAAAIEGAVSGITTNTASSSSSIFAWTDKEAIFQPTFLPPILSSTEGKYAHVVFSSAKEMKQAKKALEDVMSTSTSSSMGKDSSRRRSKGRNKSNKQGNEQAQERALILDKLELQTLSDESQRQREELFRQAMKEDYENDDDDDFEDSDNEGIKSRSQTTIKKHSGVLAVAQRYRESCKLLKSPAKLMEECNAVMEAYEEAEEAKRRAREAAKAEPDEDGFVSVSYSNAVGSKIEFEQSATATTPSRRKGNKRSRKKKEAVGSGELKDFYRFQRADNRKRTMQDLRRQFEEDVRKVKRLKQEKEYRPF